MKNRDAQEGLIVGAVQELLQTQGPPYPQTRDIAEQSGLSRQLIRYYFDDPEDLICKTCDDLADAYRTAFVNGASGLSGADRLQFIFDFYFDMVDEHPKPRDDRIYDAAFAYATGSDKVRRNLRGQYKLVGQLLQVELKMQYPDLSLEDCAEISYLFVTVMYGHWKMVATLGLNEDHKLVARRSVDRIIASFVNNDVEKIENVRVWET